MNVKELIEQVIHDIADDKPLQSIVSKVQLISRLLKNESFTSWVNCEFINGYNSDDIIPSYREVNVGLVQASFIEYFGHGGMKQYKNFNVPIGNLNTEDYDLIRKVRITNTVMLVESAISPDKDIKMALSQYELICVQELLRDCEISSVYKIISNQSFMDIVNQTRAKLLDIFIEFNETLFNNELDFNAMTKKDEIQQVVTNHINASVVNMGDGSIDARNSNNIGGTNNTVTINPEAKDELINIAKKIEALSQEVDCDRTDIAEAIIEIKHELDKPDSKPSLLKTLFKSIKGCIHNTVCVQAGQAIEQLVDKGIEKIGSLNI